MKRKNNDPLTKCKFQSGVGGDSSRGFSHERHVLPDTDAHRNPLRNLHQPSVCLKTDLRR